MKFIKYLKLLLKTFFLTSLISIILWTNFNFNYIFYYNNSTLTDKSKLPFIVIDYLDFEVIDTVEIDNYLYQTSGINSISFKDKDSNYFWAQNTYPKSTYQVDVTINEASTLYFIDASYEILEKYSYHESPKLTEEIIFDEDKITVIRITNDIVKQMLNSVSEPIINLQGLFDFSVMGVNIPIISLIIYCLTKGIKLLIKNVLLAIQHQ